MIKNLCFVLAIASVCRASIREKRNEQNFFLDLYRDIVRTIQQPGGLADPLRTQADPQPRSLGDLGRTLSTKIGFCGKSQEICEYLSCSARNFQRDQSFANLQFATKVLADPELRKSVTESPQLLNVVCGQAGLDGSACSMLKRGFTLIDKLMTYLESGNSPPANADRISRGKRSIMNDFYEEFDSLLRQKRDATTEEKGSGEKESAEKGSGEVDPAIAGPPPDSYYYGNYETGNGSEEEYKDNGPEDCNKYLKG